MLTRRRFSCLPLIFCMVSWYPLPFELKLHPAENVILLRRTVDCALSINFADYISGSVEL